MVMIRQQSIMALNGISEIQNEVFLARDVDTKTFIPSRVNAPHHNSITFPSNAVQLGQTLPD